MNKQFVQPRASYMRIAQQTAQAARACSGRRSSAAATGRAIASAAGPTSRGSTLHISRAIAHAHSGVHGRICAALAPALVMLAQRGAAAAAQLAQVAQFKAVV